MPASFMYRKIDARLCRSATVYQLFGLSPGEDFKTLCNEASQVPSLNIVKRIAGQ